MLTSSSIVNQTNESNGATCLAEVLFPGARVDNRVVPSGGFSVRCDYCTHTVLNVIGDAIAINQRHGTKWHRTVVSLAELGLKRI